MSKSPFTIWRQSHVSAVFAPPRVTSLGAALTLLLVAISGVALIAVWLFTRIERTEASDSAITHTVARDDFVLAITERGEVESSGVTEIRSEVETKNTPGLAILRVVPEGTAVKEGDFLVELDSSALKAERDTQQIAVNAAEALVVEARNLYETAVIAHREYLEGTFIQERQTIESEVFVAEENLNRAKEYFEYSKKLAAKGYVKQLELEADEFAVEKSRKELDAARTKLKVLEQFTREKMVKQLESDIKITEARWLANKKSHQIEVDKLAEIEDQISKCTLTAPRDGMVVYAHRSDVRGSEDFVVEEGAMVRERQPIIRLPDASSMRVVLKINESLIQYVRAGMPATISPVGLGDIALRGTVEKVNRYAEPTGWRKANVKEYKAWVAVDGLADELRSGMTASVTIQCLYVPDALQVPVQAVLAHGDDFFCVVYQDGRWEARPVTCGPTNDKYFVVEQGLQPNERVSMNPRRYIDQIDLPELQPEETQNVVRRAPLHILQDDTSQASANPPQQPAALQAADKPQLAAGEQPAVDLSDAQPAAEKPATVGTGDELGGHVRLNLTTASNSLAASIRELRKDYVLGGEAVHALRGVSFDVPYGDYISIMGPSGSGKSTLLNLLGCLDRPTAGNYLLADTDAAHMNDDQLAETRATRIGFIFQSYNLLPALTVVENIEVPLNYSGRMGRAGSQKCMELAELVGLGDRLHHRPAELSGGQQQRVAIARSLVNDPQFILADEPTGNLDSVTTEEILDLLSRLNDEEGRTIILVTHEPDVADRTKRKIFLRDGQIISDERHRAL